MPFELAAELEWRKAVISIDDRFMYGEERRIAFAPMRGRLYTLCYVFRGRSAQIAAVCRTRSSACDTLSRSRARHVLCWLAFPSIPARRSTCSAGGRPALFAGFVESGHAQN